MKNASSEVMFVKNKSVQGIPKSEIIWETIVNNKGKIFFITSKERREEYFLYVEQNGKIQKIAKAKTPIRLYEKI